MTPQCRWLSGEVLAASLDAPVSRVAPWVDALNRSFEHAQLYNDDRLAAYLAQIGHETAGLRWIEELWGPTPTQRRYEGRKDLGNTQPGDGHRYRGRGLIQTTGRANYFALTGSLRATFGDGVPNFVEFPEMLLQPRWAALSASSYWLRRGCNRFVDDDDFIGLTRRINGGTNGLADRRRRLQLATEALS